MTGSADGVTIENKGSVCEARGAHAAQHPIQVGVSHLLFGKDDIFQSVIISMLPQSQI